MKLPPPQDDPTWSRIRAHDLEELWDASLAPHVAASYQARMALLAGIAERLTGPTGKLLDVGCSQGTLGLMLAERGLRVELLDVRGPSIAYARARHEHGDVAFHVGTLGPSCPPASDYDLVMCTEVIEHVPAPSELLLALKQKVRPGGALLLTTPNADYLLGRLPTYANAPQATIDDAEPNSMDGDAHRYLYTREELIALVRGAGFKLEDHGFFLPVWMEGHAKTRHLHRLAFSVRKELVRLRPTLPAALGRRLCASQYLVGRLT
jgi:2-polyprenyl-3-methyl-5-hydroxy-6-metoxy-1,4-benzoquinol methylase